MADDDLFVSTGATFRIADPDRSKYFTFLGQRENGEYFDIAKINMFTGEVTFESPAAGHDAAEAFWNNFGSYIAGMVDEHLLKKEKNAGS